MQRPTAQELLRHRFFKVARKTSTLTELIERYQRWRREEGEEEESHNDTTEYVVCVCKSTWAFVCVFECSYMCMSIMVSVNVYGVYV